MIATIILAAIAATACGYMAGDLRGQARGHRECLGALRQTLGVGL